MQLNMATANTSTPSAQDDFTLSVKVRLLELGWTVTQLAQELGYARNTVSMAINHPTLLRGVKQQIRRRLKL